MTSDENFPMRENGAWVTAVEAETAKIFHETIKGLLAKGKTEYAGRHSLHALFLYDCIQKGVEARLKKKEAKKNDP